MSTDRTTSLEAKLDGILRRHDELGRLMASASGDEYSTLAKEYAELDAIAASIQALRATRGEAGGIREMLSDAAQIGRASCRERV